ncbi:acetyltransferase [Chitinophaga sp. S165]|uniref:acetyltransferase n=1 Tax=Chitinophaga sp. S165 TaxID=2135462 RepID=UPI000D9025C9|nr:acetyltransferase [Chitinophaga sp. S165]PWV56517.1 acetyltransferase EpsM [Chitinophaga sp. S165]
MDNPKIFICGAGGHAKVVLEILEVLKYNCAGIFDDNPDLKELLGYPVLGRWDPARVTDAAKIILAIGNNAVRKKLAETMNCQWGNAIHPSANISTRCSIDMGTVVMAGVSVNSCVSIGRHAIINTNASVDHDCKLANYVHISPNAALAGNVTVGEGTHIGIGSSIKQGVKIGSWSVIGAGTVVTGDVPDNVVIVGNPGRILKEIE